MDEIEKFLRKISEKDRIRLVSVIALLIARELKNLDIKKIQNSDMYRVRVGRFRIIYFIEQETDRVVIVGVRYRSEGTYKDV